MLVNEAAPGRDAPERPRRENAVREECSRIKTP